MPDQHTDEALTLMLRFAERTGLVPGRPPTRYLWTDAFAVCNFLGLARAAAGTRCEELALRLVDQVHHTLGRHRAGDVRTGWISGAVTREGEAHPTLGGLRIGKHLPERGVSERFDERLEWERDGQYFHYLTKWMHALDCLASSTGQVVYNVWACELARAAHAAFTYVPDDGGRPRMYWKMSIDLSRPLVPSMGQHDPLDGYLTCLQLEATALRMDVPAGAARLRHELRELAAMIDRDRLATADPLGLGGLLTDAARLDLLAGHAPPTDAELFETLLSAALAGLDQWVGQGDLRAPARHRLAFRELGLAIGLHAVARMQAAAAQEAARFSDSVPARALLRALAVYAPLREAIETFWRDPRHQAAPTWSEHRDINEVMLATALVPDGFLGLSPRP